MAQKSLADLDLTLIAKWHNRCLLLVALIVLTRVGLIVVNAYGFTGLAITISMWAYHAIALLWAAYVIVATQRSMGSSGFAAAFWIAVPLGIVAMLLQVVHLPGALMNMVHSTPNSSAKSLMFFLSAWTFVSLIILLIGLAITSSSAKRTLHLAGVKTGFFGVSKHHLDALHSK